MKKLIYLSFICCGILFYNCSNRKENQSFMLELEKVPLEKKSSVTKEEAYSLLINQKLYEYVDRQKLMKEHPEFSTHKDVNSLFPFLDTNSSIESIDSSPLSIVTDSTKLFKTIIKFKINNVQRIDSIRSKIISSQTIIDGESYSTTNVFFNPYVKKQKPIIKSESIEKPSIVEKFSLHELSFTWDEINNCDCLFIIKPKPNTITQKLYFGRLKNSEGAILQLEKEGLKTILPVLRSRKQQRTTGDSWIEIYANKTYKVVLKATPAKMIIDKKQAYHIDFKLTVLDSNEIIKDMVLVNCKS